MTISRRIHTAEALLFSAQVMVKFAADTAVTAPVRYPSVDSSLVNRMQYDVLVPPPFHDPLTYPQ